MGGEPGCWLATHENTARSPRCCRATNSQAVRCRYRHADRRRVCSRLSGRLSMASARATSEAPLGPRPNSLGEPEPDSGLLKGKRALVFAAAGSIGAAIAREFAAQGAEVFMSGRTESNVKTVAGAITAGGGQAHATTLDAVDEAAVGGYVDGVARDGRIDVVFNAIGPLTRDFGGGKRALDLTVDELMVPLTTVVRSSFVTACAAGRHMTRQLALELGPVGVRAVCLRTSAMPDTRTIMDVMQSLSATLNVTEEQAAQMLASQTVMQKSPASSETARVAAFLASDHARTITGIQVMSEIR